MPVTAPSVSPTAAAAADRRNFGELKAELARTSNDNDPTTLALAADAINASIRSFNRYLWPWEVLEQDITLAAGVDVYSLPQMFKSPMAAYFLRTARQDDRIDYVPYASFINQSGIRADGKPYLYTLRNQFETGQVTFYPRPQAQDSVRVTYYRITPTLNQDTNVIEMPSYAEGALLEWAWYEFLKRLGGEANIARLASAFRAAREARSELVYMANSRGDMSGIA